MPKYWGKNYFAHGSFLEVGQKQKMEEKERKKREREQKLVITMAKLRMAHASTHGARKPPGPTWDSHRILMGFSYMGFSWLNLIKNILAHFPIHIVNRAATSGSPLPPPSLLEGPGRATFARQLHLFRSVVRGYLI